MEESEEGQSPIKKSTREGSPDNGSQGGSASNPDYEIDSSNLGGREEDQSPTRKRAREDSPDNGSQHEYTSDRGRVRARGRAVLGVDEEPGVGAPLGEGAKQGKGESQRKGQN